MNDDDFSTHLDTQTIELQMVSPKSAAKLLDCHRSFIDTLIKRGDLQAVKLGPHCKRINLKSLNEFLSRVQKTENA